MNTEQTPGKSGIVISKILRSFLCIVLSLSSFWVVFGTDQGGLSFAAYERTAAGNGSEESIIGSAASGSADGALPADFGSSKAAALRVPRKSAPANLPYLAKSFETEGTYSDSNINIALTKYTGDNLVYHVADIQLSGTSYLKAAFAFGMYEGKGRQYTSEMAYSSNAILAINGDYYNFRNDGIILRNGVLYRDIPSNRQALIIDRNGDYHFQYENGIDADALVSEAAVQVLSFGPALLIDGAILELPEKYFISTNTRAPRTAICQAGPLHYIFLVVDGRQEGYSMGVSLNGLAKIAQSLGCTACYNLDGGGSSAMVFQGKLVNRPSSNGKVIEERSISDIIYIG